MTLCGHILYYVTRMRSTCRAKSLLVFHSGRTHIVLYIIPETFDKNIFLCLEKICIHVRLYFVIADFSLGVVW